MDQLFLEHVHVFMGAFLMWGVISYFAWTRGFYILSYSACQHKRSISLGLVLTAFGVLLAMELIVVPLGVSLKLLLEGHRDLQEGLEHLNVQTRGWLNLMAIFTSALAVLIYGCTLHFEARKTLFWGGGMAKKVPEVFGDVGMGIMAWGISYPLIIVISQGVEALFYLAGYTQPVDQVAVKNLRAVLSYPLLLACTIFVIVIVVPFAEEMLFRGFFQNWMMQRVNRRTAIVVTSLLFAGFHFSISQGWGNVELLLSLFVLSCYLGFIYERQQSLWAPWGLHMAFNAFSTAIILLQDPSNSV